MADSESRPSGDTESKVHRPRLDSESPVPQFDQKDNFFWDMCKDDVDFETFSTRALEWLRNPVISSHFRRIERLKTYYGAETPNEQCQVLWEEWTSRNEGHWEDYLEKREILWQEYREKCEKLYEAYRDRRWT